MLAPSECFLEVGSRISDLEDAVEEELRYRGHRPLHTKAWRGMEIGCVMAERGARIMPDDLSKDAQVLADAFEQQWRLEGLIPRG